MFSQKKCNHSRGKKKVDHSGTKIFPKKVIVMKMLSSPSSFIKEMVGKTNMGGGSEGKQCNHAKKYSA